MQSFIQYRRFRDAAKAQIERDRERAVTGGSPENTTDVEKGQTSGDAAIVNHEPNEIPTSPDDDSGKSPQDLEPTEEKVEEDPLEDEDEDDDFELSQHARSTLSRTTTQNSTGTALGLTLTGIEVRRRTTREGGEGNVFVVGYEGPHDPNDPHNWSNWRRLGCTVPLALIGAVVGFASAVDSPVSAPSPNDLSNACCHIRNNINTKLIHILFCVRQFHKLLKISGSVRLLKALRLDCS
jgi:hypothetical protein